MRPAAAPQVEADAAIRGRTEREQRLLERFGSLDLIRRATPAQLARTPGIGHATATSILAALHEEDPARGAVS